jgi:hypothetical protein
MMKTLVVLLSLIGCAMPVSAECLSEAEITTQLQTNYPEVTVLDRFEGLQAKKFVELYAQAVGKEREEFATIDLVVVYTKPDGHTYKLALFSASCVAGSGHMLKDFYPDFLARLRLASSF